MKNMKFCFSFRLKGAFVVAVVLIVALRCYRFQNDAIRNFDKTLLLSIESSEVEENSTNEILSDSDTNGIPGWSSYMVLHSTLDEGYNNSNHTVYSRANQTIETTVVKKNDEDEALGKSRGGRNHTLYTGLHNTLVASTNFSHPKVVSSVVRTKKATKKNITDEVLEELDDIVVPSTNYSNQKLGSPANRTTEATKKNITDEVRHKVKGSLNHDIHKELDNALVTSANYSNQKLLSPANRTTEATKKNITDEVRHNVKGSLNHDIHIELDDALVTSANYSTQKVSQSHQNSCTWRGLGRDALDCTNMLNKRLLDSKIHMLTSKRWVFMGDSTMARLFFFVRASMPAFFNSCNCQFKDAPRCDMYESFGLTKKKSSWKRPVKGLEGPIAYGLGVPHCQDCKGCNSVLVECEHSPCNHTTISYIGVEFARDVVMQTELERTNTTQESITKYLKNRQCLVHPFICIVNTGLHDMIILKSDGKTFIKNLEWYLTLIQPCCKHLVWIQTTAVLDEKSRPQKNSIIKVWNAKVQTLLQGKRFQTWTSIVDPYNVSRFWPHADNVHLNMSYYAALASLFPPFL